MKARTATFFSTTLAAIAGGTLLFMAHNATAAPIQTMADGIPDSSVWLEQKVAASDGVAGVNFATSLAMQGNIAVIGVPFATVKGNASQGVAYVFTKTNGSWSETAKLSASDGVAQGKFGTDVAIVGNRVLIGAPGGAVFLQPSIPGAVYLFTRTQNGWTQTAKFTDTADDAGAEFGEGVALDANHILIGAPNAEVNGNFGQGDAWVFTKSAGGWGAGTRLVANDGSFGDIFGRSLAISGTTAIIGANGAAINGNFSQGAVYVFTRGGNGWSQSQKLIASDGASGDVFGIAIALSGDNLLVGAESATAGGNSYEGAAYIFNNNGGVWSQAQKIFADNGASGDDFGSSVALDGDTALVGSPGNKFFQGTAYIFKHLNGSWKQTLQLDASDQKAFAQFGSSAALSGSTALVGADDATVGGNSNQGAAYFYGNVQLGLALSVPDRVNPGSQFTTATIATNSSSATSPAVAVSIAVPAAATFISATATQGGCTESSRVVHCQLGAIAGNAGSATANVTFKTLGQGGDTIASRAEVIRSTPPLSTAESTAINHPPVADDGRLMATQGRPTSGALKASDADGDPLTYSIVSQPQHGSLTINDASKGVYTYTPAADYVGADHFTFKVNDGYADSNVATVIISVTNQPPVASDSSLTTTENTAANGRLKASDPDGDALSFSIVAPPVHGSVTLDATTGNFTYTPATDYFGADSFTFKANDGQSDSNTAIVTITVNGSAPPPPTPPPANNGGGGGFGGLLLLALALLAGTVFLIRRRGKFRACARAGTQTGNYSHSKEMSMQRKWTGVSMIGMIALATALVSMPMAGQAATASTSTAGKTGYRAGLAMPLPSTAPARRITMAPQSNLQLLASATKLGAHASGAPIEITIGLKLRNLGRLQTFLQEVQNPTSPAYHHWLTPKEFTAQYGPTEADVAKVTAFLKAQGIKVESISRNRTLIYTLATTQTYENAFSVKINDYSLAGRNFYSTSDSPMLPRAIAPLVSNILGLNHGVQMRPRSRLERLGFDQRVAPQAAPPASTAYFNPQQIAKAYDWPDITDTNNGTGVSIAILTAMTPGVADNPNYDTFWSTFGLPSHTINVIPIGGASAAGGAPETTLDIEWSGAMAPGAALNVYVAANGNSDTFTDMYNQFVIDNNSQVMTTSWGLSETAAPDINLANEQIFMQAAAQGISMFAAAGDSGASDCNPFGYCPPGPNNADFPSSSEYITAANGTNLSISNVSGTYGSEQAWPDTGGAISQLFSKPSWQTGPGVPTNINMRMNSDMSLNAGGLHPFMIYVNGPQGTGFYGIAGTSAVAPILAGLFAIGVSQQPGGASLGQSNSLIYDDVNAGNYGSDFHDVTSGCNGYLPDGTTPSCATTNWDHPTGWGSPKAESLLSHLGVHGPAGTLTGTVTVAASGAPIAGATVTVTAQGFSESRTTKDDGTYLFALPVGNYTAGVVSFGFKNASAPVAISNGDSTTQDFALSAAAAVTLSGKVSDGSGHGYGLYAEIKATVQGFGQVADFWTSAANGKYNVKLPTGFTYHLNAQAAFNGYAPASATVSLPANATQNFKLQVTDACTAPGYSTPFSEDFNTQWPPKGWTVTNEVNGSLIFWQPNVNWGSDNWTGGTGAAAEAASGSGSSFGPYDTSLVTPPISASAVRANPILRYKANYQPAGIMQTLDLDISTDGGTNWTNIVHWVNTVCGGNGSLPGCVVQVNLASFLPAHGDFQLRWHYYDSNQYAFDRYAQIDDVHIGACKAVAGGLVFGQVSDANTGDGINWASVSDDLGDQVITRDNPADPNFPVGGYLLFSPAGSRTLTASDYRYQNATASFTSKDGSVKAQNFALKAGQLTHNPALFDLHVMVNNQVTRSLKLQNTGGIEAHYELATANAPPPATRSAAGAPLIRIKGDYSPLQLTASRLRRQVKPQAEPTPLAAPWQDIANYPVAVMDNGVVRDPSTGLIYSVDGVNGLDYFNSVYVYDPATNTWSLATRNKIAREAPQVAFIGGKLYLVGGWLSTGGAAPQLEIYDATTGNWTNGADIPTAYAGAGHAVVDGKFYIVGGCANGFSCDSSNVQVYDPTSNSWAKLADYPHPVSWEACGGIDGKLYCAGGTSGTHTLYRDAYVYNPASNQWSPIQDLPIYLWGSGYAATNGELLVSGGISGFRVLTNAGYAYDPAVNRWHTAPNSNYALYRGGSACGFYKIGGSQAGFLATPNAEWLPGYGQCGKPAPIPWLTLTPASGTIGAGGNAQSTLIFDGNGEKEFTTSKAYLQVRSNTPYPDAIIPVTVTWDPQKVNLVLSGQVSPASVKKGNNLAYTVTVTNSQADNHGAATEVTLDYPLPQGVSYEAASGDASCVASPAGGSAPAPASGEDGASSVTCDFGTIALGASKTETLAVMAGTAGKLTSNFEVSAREPESNNDDNHLSLSSEVIGSADLSLNADSTSIPVDTSGQVTLTLKNAGPDPASEVEVHVAVGGTVVSLQAASASQGGCATAGGGLTCKLGQVDAGKTATVTLNLFGAYAGSATVNAQASTASVEPNPGNNGVSVKVAVKAAPPPPKNGGGGGAFGWLALAALLALGFASRLHRRPA